LFVSGEASDAGTASTSDSGAETKDAGNPTLTVDITSSIGHDTVHSDGAIANVSPDPDEIPDSTLAISGKVMGADNLVPVVGAIVSTEPSIGQVMTNGEGNFVFTGDGGAAIEVGTQYRVTANRQGYLPSFATVTVQAGHNRNVDIQLTEANANEEWMIVVNPVSLSYDSSSFTTGDTAVQKVTLSMDSDSPSGAQQAFTIDVPIQHQSWLAVMPSSGTVGDSPMNLNVQVDKNGVVGMLTGSFDVIAAGGLPLTIQITVDLSGANAE
jgi:hypothetical protein